MLCYFRLNKGSFRTYPRSKGSGAESAGHEEGRSSRALGHAARLSRGGRGASGGACVLGRRLRGAQPRGASARARGRRCRTGWASCARSCRGRWTPTSETGAGAGRGGALPARHRPGGVRAARGRADRAAASIRAIAAAPDLVVRHGLSPRGEPGGARPRLPRHARAGRGGGAGAGPRRDGAGRTGRADAGRDAGFIVRTPVFVDGGRGGARRFWGIVSAVIDAEALYRASGLGDPRPAGSTWRCSGRDGRIGDGRPFFGDPAILAAGPGHRRGEPAVGRLADRRGAEGRLAAAAGALGAARALRAGGPAHRGADHRRGAARRGAPGQDRADPRPRGGALAAVVAAGVRAGGLGGRGLGRGPRDRRAALGRADQAALRPAPAARGRSARRTG